MVTSLVRLAWIVLVVPGLAACVSDQMVALKFDADSRIEHLPSPRAMTVFRFADRRGDEGDGNPRRVGGIYGGVVRATRVAKIYATTPWPEALVQNLTAAFRARGVEAIAVDDQEYLPGRTTVSTPLVLAGEIRNFSTEQRWAMQAHVSGFVRLYDHQGVLLLEKEVSARMPRDEKELRRTRDGSRNLYEDLLNGAIEVFVRRVVTDLDLTQRVTAKP